MAATRSDFPGWSPSRKAAGPSVEQVNQEENARAFGDILQLLVAAGYFRARLEALSPFDRVIGGLAWCIACSSADLDVDVAFVEDATIGQKIRMGEGIERCIQRFKACPFRLQAHQIQGLDYAAIFPVIQWLVKEVITSRKEREASLRRVSEEYHARSFARARAASAATAGELSSARSAAARMAHMHGPRRAFRRKLGPQPPHEARARLVLMEYATPSGAASAALPPARPASSHGSPRRAGTVGNASAEPEAAPTGALAPPNAELMDVRHDPATSSVGAAHVGELVSLGADVIRREGERYRAHAADLDASQAAAASGGTEVALSDRRAALLRHEAAQAELTHRDLTAALSEARAALDAARREHAGASRQLMDALERRTAADERALATAPAEAAGLRALLVELDELKREERGFKEKCRNELPGLEARAAAAEAPAADTGAAADDELERIGHIERIHAQELSNLSQLRAAHATKCLRLAHARRAVDEVPTRTELVQYERRFVELHDEVASKHAETKRFFALYNGLQDQQTLLEKEASILTSIHDRCPTDGAARESKLQFGESIEALLRNVHQSVSKSQAKVAREAAERSALQRRLDELVELQRKYASLVQELQTECQQLAPPQHD